MQTKILETPLLVDAAVPEANALGDRAMPSGLTLRQELVRDYMKQLLDRHLGLQHQEAECYDEVVSDCMTDAAHRAHMTLMIMTTIRPLEIAPAEDSPIVSPETALIVRGH